MTTVPIGVRLQHLQVLLLFT